MTHDDEDDNGEPASKRIVDAVYRSAREGAAIAVTQAASKGSFISPRNVRSER